MGELDDLQVKTSESKKRIGRSVSINGVHAVEVDVNKSENLNDPIVDVNLKINNPIGRLWLALKRLWKSQNTVISLKFTIPLIVLPIAIYIGWRLWQGRGVNTPISKLGMIHEVRVSGEPQDILVVPTSDVYLLKYSVGFEASSKIVEKPVVIIGTYSHLNNTVTVEEVIAYNPLDIAPTTPALATSPTMWDNILRFIAQFK